MNYNYLQKHVEIMRTVTLALTFLMSCEACSAEPQTVTFLDNSFSVIMPAGWSLLDGINEEADLQMGNTFKEAYAIILSENKMDFANMTLQGHSDITRALIRDSLENYREYGPEMLDNGNIAALRYRMEGTIDNINVIYWHVTLETKTHYHQLLMWSLRSKFASNEADFNSLTRSIKEVTD